MWKSELWNIRANEKILSFLYKLFQFFIVKLMVRVNKKFQKISKFLKNPPIFFSEPKIGRDLPQIRKKKTDANILF